MSLTPDHQDLQDLLPAAALEILEGEELEQIMAHVPSCAACAGLLDEYRGIVAALGARLPAREMRPHRGAALRSRLMVRAGAERASNAATYRRFRMVSWTGWLVAAGVASILLVHHSIHRTLDYGWLAAGVLGLILVAVGAYALIRRGRAAALRGTPADLERNRLNRNI